MGRPRKFANFAEKQADYRNRKKEKEALLLEAARPAQEFAQAARKQGIGDESMSDAEIIQLCTKILRERFGEGSGKN